MRDKTLFWLLTLYVLLQLAALFLGVGLFFILYLIIYLAVLIYAAIQTSKAVIQRKGLKTFLPVVASSFIANLILFLIYIPALIYNPEINWKLKGEAEQDPMILQAYVPPVLFCIFLIGQLLTALVTKFISGAKTKMRTT